MDNLKREASVQDLLLRFTQHKQNVGTNLLSTFVHASLVPTVEVTDTWYAYSHEPLVRRERILGELKDTRRWGADPAGNTPEEAV